MMASYSFAHDCETLKAENQTLINQILERKHVVWLEPFENEFQSNQINVKLLKVVGDKKTQTVKMDVLFTNKGVNIDKMITKVKSIIQAGGDEVLLNKVILGSKENTNSGYSGAYVKLLRDEPLKCTYIFKGVVPETKVIIAFPLSFKYHKEGTQTTQFIEDRVLFNDLLIDWK